MTGDQLIKSAIIVAAFLFVRPCVRAGDAVVVGYNADDVWTSVTYYCSGTAKGGKDYKTSIEAIAQASKDLRKRGATAFSRVDVIATSDQTTFAAVARGREKGKKELNVAEYGKTQAEADANALEKLSKQGATEKQKIVYRYFSHGTDSSNR